MVGRRVPRRRAVRTGPACTGRTRAGRRRPRRTSRARSSPPAAGQRRAIAGSARRGWSGSSAGHGRLDRHPQAWRELARSKRAPREGVLAPSTCADRTSASSGCAITTAASAAVPRLAGGRHEVGDAHHAHGGQQRQRGVGGQQPAPEVARLQRQIDEQREWQRDEDEPAHESRRGAHRTGERSPDAGPAQPPGQAVEVVGDPPTPGPAWDRWPLRRPGRAGQSTSGRASRTRTG